MMKTSAILKIFIFWMPSLWHLIKGHGRLMDPPARNSMWRFGYPNPVNYNDNELYCGGFSVQWDKNKGKCGLCGDPYHIKSPRPHEAGGLYAKGIISRHYTVGDAIDIEVDLTANHYGRFEILLCPNNNPAQEATQECFDRFPLKLAGTPHIAFEIPEDGRKKVVFNYKVQLPPYITCTQCVVQWTYYTGNQWGLCPNGSEAMGCGRSETFRNCADIAIYTSTGGGIPPIFATEVNPFLLYLRDATKPPPYNMYPLIVREQVCIASSQFRESPGIHQWCQTNCMRYPPNCPRNICQCPTTCNAIGTYAGNLGADLYCMDQCIVYPSHCPNTKCSCYEEVRPLD